MAKFLATWRANPELLLKLAYHGTAATNVASICAAGLRPAHAGGCAFLASNLSKALAYCDWRMVEGGEADVAALPLTGMIVVCALLVDPADEAAGGDATASTGV